MAAELRHLLDGEQGYPEWGPLFRDIERDGLSVGLELARLLMEQSTSRQTGQRPPAAMQVPGDVVQPAGTEPAQLNTPAGEVAWEAPCGRLNEARKFFSSPQGTWLSWCICTDDQVSPRRMRLGSENDSAGRDVRETLEF